MGSRPNQIWSLSTFVGSMEYIECEWCVWGRERADAHARGAKEGTKMAVEGGAGKITACVRLCLLVKGGSSVLKRVWNWFITAQLSILFQRRVTSGHLAVDNIG